MVRSTFQLAACLLAGVLLLGCDKPAVDALAEGAPAASSAPAPSSPGPTGFIRGKVLFAGAPPAPRPIDNRICPHAKPIFDEPVVVNANGTLRNVVVYLNGVAGPLPPDVPVIPQADCHYVTHVT